MAENRIVAWGSGALPKVTIIRDDPDCDGRTHGDGTDISFLGTSHRERSASPRTMPFEFDMALDKEYDSRERDRVDTIYVRRSKSMECDRGSRRKRNADESEQPIDKTFHNRDKERRPETTTTRVSHRPNKDKNRKDKKHKRDKYSTTNNNVQYNKDHRDDADFDRRTHEDGTDISFLGTSHREQGASPRTMPFKFDMALDKDNDSRERDRDRDETIYVRRSKSMECDRGSRREPNTNESEHALDDIYRLTQPIDKTFNNRGKERRPKTTTTRVSHRPNKDKSRKSKKHKRDKYSTTNNNVQYNRGYSDYADFDKRTHEDGTDISFPGTSHREQVASPRTMPFKFDMALDKDNDSRERDRDNTIYVRRYKPMEYDRGPRRERTSDQSKHALDDIYRLTQPIDKTFENRSYNPRHGERHTHAPGLSRKYKPIHRTQNRGKGGRSKTMTTRVSHIPNKDKNRRDRKHKRDKYSTPNNNVRYNRGYSDYADFDKRTHEDGDTMERDRHNTTYVRRSKSMESDRGSRRERNAEESKHSLNDRYRHALDDGYRLTQPIDKAFENKSYNPRHGERQMGAPGLSRTYYPKDGTQNKAVGLDMHEDNSNGFTQINKRKRSSEDNTEDQTQSKRRKVSGFKDTCHRPKTAIDTLSHLDKKDAGEIVTALLDRSSLLKDWLLESQRRVDILPLILSVLSKAFSCKHLSCKTSDLYQLTIDAGFFNNLALYLVDLHAHGGFEHFHGNGLGTVLDNILTILLEITSRSPSSIHTFSRIHHALGLLIEEVEKAGGFHDDVIKMRYKDLSDRKDRDTRKQKETVTHLSDKPPDDFRCIDIFPREQDIHSTVEPFIRKNKTKGIYINLDHYLDVQFRLLREDFIGPLRDGLNEYIRSTKTADSRRKHKHNVRLYRNVRIISPVCLAEGLCFKIQLNTMGNDWRSRKRLIFGSLLCLTSDNFKTFFIATVAGRDDDDLKAGYIYIRFETTDISMNAKAVFSTSFTMAETTTYFESYRHVLSGLQTFQEGDLPFERYLLKCETTVKPPAYLNQDTTFDFGPLVNDDMTLTNIEYLTKRKMESDRTPVKVLDVASWPTPDRLHLDDSQYNAIRSALTKEFALIQGPPGTGKTYVGWKIAQVLLHNREKTVGSKSEGSSPMLIVCYTNHALDQFLEGIVRFNNHGTIVRVGSRSKSNLLEDFTLQNIKSKMTRGMNRRLLNGQMEDVARSINHVNAKIDGYRSYLLHSDFLERFIPERLFRKLKASSRNQHLGRVNMVAWLEIGNVVSHFERDSNELREMTSNSEFEAQHAITLSNNRRHHDRREEQFDKERLSEKVKVMDDILRTSVAFYHNTVDKPDTMNDQTWERERLKRIKKNSIIRRYICYQDVMSVDEESHVGDPWRLSVDNRWRMYRLWIRRVCEAQYDRIAELQDEYKGLSVRYKETQRQEDMAAMKQADVIGMTTTCAARYLAILQDIAPSIVIVEEAAEVLEAHIVTTLSRGCQHLILIGDHKQLQPNPSVYKLATKFNMNVSLFERMILNGVHYDSLEYQHRMRPEISILMRHFYTNLKDHESVETFERIKGVKSNIFLLNHGHRENIDSEGTSHSNAFEAEYAASLCRYLIQQGYSPSKITVLSTYTSQMFLLRKEMPKDSYGGVTITVVDNYQGEENDIVILSLVRSNEAGDVGFIKKENRVCVALSRAKMGFYIIGNFDLLSSQSDLWKSIVEDMKERGYIGDALGLYCQNHPECDPLIAKTATDYTGAPEGGCKKLCKARLACGHSCKMYCHPTDNDHEQYKCDEECTKSCDNGHPCRERCYDDCGPCPVIIKKNLIVCDHVASMPCGTPEYLYHCTEACEEILGCGHACQNDCGSSHTVRCKFEVKKTFLCGHSRKVACFLSETAKCKEKCGTTLSCGHACSGSCIACCNGRFHQACTKKCGRLLVCGHECLASCNLCLPCTRPCQNKCRHNECKLLCGEPCNPCMEKCDWQCKHKQCTRPCSEPCDRGPCNKLCKKTLECKHPCIGLCGEPCPSQCRICNKEEVTTILFGDEDRPQARFILLQDCGHIIESRALDKYMENNLVTGDTIIQLKGCPVCKTPIRKSYRYGNMINKTLGDIENVKKAIIGDEEKIDKMALDPMIRYMPLGSFYFLRQWLQRSTTYARGIRLQELEKYKILSAQHLVSFHNQRTLLDTLVKLKDGCSVSRIGIMSVPVETVAGKFPYRYDDDADVLDEMMRRLSRSYTILTEQEIDEIKNELERYAIMSKLLTYGRTIPDAKMDEAKPDFEVLQKISRMVTVVGHETETAEAYANLQKLASGIGISDDEREMILKTVGLSKGHWYKCPNGHVYAIGECGGATEDGVCPECQATIGGTEHKLAAGNSVATEMDGAKFGAYSEEANNLGNFELEFDD